MAIPLSNIETFTKSRWFWFYLVLAMGSMQSNVTVEAPMWQTNPIHIRHIPGVLPGVYCIRSTFKLLTTRYQNQHPPLYERSIWSGSCLGNNGIPSLLICHAATHFGGGCQTCAWVGYTETHPRKRVAGRTGLVSHRVFPTGRQSASWQALGRFVGYN